MYKLVRPVAGVGEFVFAEAPAIHLLAQAFGNLRIVRQEVEKALHVVLVLLPDLRPAGVAGVGIVPTAADEVGGESAIVVDVGLAVGDAVDFDH